MIGRANFFFFSVNPVLNRIVSAEPLPENEIPILRKKNVGLYCKSKGLHS
jgi:hypothetical protein